MTVMEIPGRAVAKQRARTVNGHTYTPARTRHYEELVAMYCRAAGARFAGAVSVEITLCSKRRLAGDLDNYAKAILDGMVKGQMIADDRQVDKLIVERVENGHDCTYVEVSARGG